MEQEKGNAKNEWKWMDNCITRSMVTIKSCWLRRCPLLFFLLFRELEAACGLPLLLCWLFLLELWALPDLPFPLPPLELGFGELLPVKWLELSACFDRACLKSIERVSFKSKSINTAPMRTRIDCRLPQGISRRWKFHGRKVVKLGSVANSITFGAWLHRQWNDSLFEWNSVTVCPLSEQKTFNRISWYR